MVENPAQFFIPHERGPWWPSTQRKWLKPRRLRTSSSRKEVLQGKAPELRKVLQQKLFFLLMGF